MNFFIKGKWPHRLMVPKKKLTVPKEEKRRAGRNELVQINIHTTTLHKIIKDPLHNTRNPPQHSIVTYMRRELEKEHIYV